MAVEIFLRRDGRTLGRCWWAGKWRGDEGARNLAESLAPSGEAALLEVLGRNSHTGARKVAGGDLVEHYGPGPHPNGTPQSVHGAAFVAGPTFTTNDVRAAAAALAAGRRVKLQSVRQVSTLLTEMASIAKEAQEKGADAPDYDLCRVSVPDTNLFCVESKGIPRVKMPQLKGMPLDGSAAASLPRSASGEVDASDAFRRHLESSGVRVTEGRELASHLKATQSQLVGAKVAGMMAAHAAGKYDPSKAPIFVSRDNYVLDGHHNWASTVGIDAMDGRLGDREMNILRVDMDITDLLGESNRWTRAFGIAPKAAGAGAAVGGDRPKKKRLRESVSARRARLRALTEHLGAWNEALHPREPKGSPRGGEFTAKMTGPPGSEHTPYIARSPLGSGLENLTEAQKATLDSELTRIHGAGLEAEIGRMQNTLLQFYDEQATSGRSIETGVARRWYELAHRRCERWGKKYNTSTEVVAGMLAACSPNRKWKGERPKNGGPIKNNRDTNLNDVHALLKMLQDDTPAEITRDHATKLESGEVKLPMDIKLADLGLVAGQKVRPSELMARSRAIESEARAAFAAGGTKVAFTYQMALANSYMQVIARTQGPFGLGKLPGGKGVARNHTTALAVYRTGSADLALTDPQGGNVPKTRSFYNNILTAGKGPWTTVDTHMVRAMMSSHPNEQVRKRAMAAGYSYLGGTKSGARLPGLQDGLLYPVFAEAIIRAAKARGVEPSEMQAVVWVRWQQGAERAKLKVDARKETLAAQGKTQRKKKGGG